MNNLKRTALAIAVATLSASLHAQIQEISFTDTNNAQVFLTSGAKYLNPKNTIKLSLISGLDRYVSLSITNARGESAYNWKSTLTDVSDRLETNDGTEYYGKVATLPVLSDGQYKVTVQLLNLKSEVVSTYTYNWTLDTKAPAADDLTALASRGDATPGTTWKLGIEATLQWDIQALNVTDNNGLDSAKLDIYKEDGSLFASNPMKYDASLNKFYYSYAIASTRQAGLPTSNLDEVFQAQAVIKDIAGNITRTARQPFKLDTTVGEWTLFAVHEPGYSGSVVPGQQNFAPYKAGMTFSENPLRLVYRLPGMNYAGNFEGGLTPINSYKAPVLLADTGGYAYIEMTVPYMTSAILTDMARFSNFGAYSGVTIAFNGKLGAGVEDTPKFAGPVVERRNSKGQWLPYTELQTFPSDLMPERFDKVRFTVSPRTYQQKASGAGKSCTVPAGEASCETDDVREMNPGTQYYYRGLHSVVSTGNSALRDDLQIALGWNNKILATIDSVSLDKSTKILTLVATLSNDRDWWNYAEINKFWLTNTDTGENLPPKSSLISRVSGKYIVEFNLNDLPEGSISITSNASDRYKNTVSKLFGTFKVDRTPPAISIQYENKDITNTPTVYGLENLVLKVTDKLSEAKITRVQLFGGPTSDAVDLSWSATGKDQYAIEYPRVFPSLNDGESYRLVVTAQDMQSNTATKEVSFNYLPSNLVTLQNLNTLSVNEALRTSTGEPLAYMRTSVLRKDTGEIAKGVQTGTLTVRKDAQFPVTINGVTAQPAQTVDFTIDLGQGEEQLLPIFPGKSRLSGNASFIIEFPQLK